MLVPHQVHYDVADVVTEVAVEPTSPTPATTPPPLQELIPSTSQVAPTLPPSPHQSPIATSSSPPQQQPTQPSHTSDISMDLLNTLLETYTTLTRKVERGYIQTRGKIAKLDADEDVTLKEVAAEVAKDAEVHGKLEESQAQVYHLDLEHAQKVLSMQDDEAEPIELKEVVTTAKLMTEVVTAAATNITAAPNAARKRNGVVIRNPEETATPSVIVHSEPKSRDKGKDILVKEPKPIKKQAQIELDEAYT
uniref:Uncharacterized protein n=1 Tax=Tanacetum cinerariifolium TaxID=118510 RepID=A0A699JGC5_TANCI|nr:hypothetical protein [Tanacetum cinerariifolium]